MTINKQVIVEALEILKDRWYATNCGCKGPEELAEDEADGEDTYWTLSKNPNDPGWENDGDYRGYGLPRKIAEAFASAPEYIRWLLAENERLAGAEYHCSLEEAQEVIKAYKEQVERLEKENEEVKNDMPKM